MARQLRCEHNRGSQHQRGAAGHSGFPPWNLTVNQPYHVEAVTLLAPRGLPLIPGLSLGPAPPPRCPTLHADNPRQQGKGWAGQGPRLLQLFMLLVSVYTSGSRRSVGRRYCYCLCSQASWGHSLPCVGSVHSFPKPVVCLGYKPSGASILYKMDMQRELWSGSGGPTKVQHAGPSRHPGPYKRFLPTLQPSL